MADISRASLPNLFFDRTSSMMLVQPDAQFLFAQFVHLADVQSELASNPDAWSLMAGRGIPGGQGAAVRPYMENQLQLVAQDRIRGEAIVVSNELAKGNVGHTIRMNRPVWGGGGFSAAARLIAAGQSISTTGVNITTEQVAITIQRFAGPYDTVNSRVAPYPIDRMDAQRSVNDLAAFVGVNLARDRMKFVDSVYGSLFDQPSIVRYPGDPTNALSSDAAAFPIAGNGYRTFDSEVVFRMEQTLADASIPRFSDGMYRMVITPQQARQLRDDAAFQKMAVFESDMNPLKRSFIASLGQVEIYQCSTNTIDTTTVAGVSINHGIMFGPGAVGRVKDGDGVRVQASTDDNYGETPKVVWICYEGQSMLDNRFVVGVHSN